MSHVRIIPATFLTVFLAGCTLPSTSQTFIADCTDNIMHNADISTVTARNRCSCIKNNISHRYGSIEAASAAKRRNPAVFKRRLQTIVSNCGGTS